MQCNLNDEGRKAPLFYIMLLSYYHEVYMPNKPLRPCKHIGCAELTHNGYCDKHKIVADENIKSKRKRYDSNRPEWHSMYASKRWRDERIRYLLVNPFCAKCKEEDGTLTPANVVDHVVDHKGDYNLFWDISNWQSLCNRHHNSKTARENFIFGKTRVGGSTK